ncbi:RebB family R body protein [Agarilytica rhodophyticola]|uniref:RebB family R body protein n=1 Tax=Agarilytica rhodophyticola TaxID=1737490 RepID=UPI000B34123D|nr:RebB family R body protein [Agarilytica rhodophyticola]
MSNSTPQEICNTLIKEYDPKISSLMLVQVVAQSLGNAAQNATFSQQQQNIIINTNTAISASLLHSIGSAYSQ